MIRLVAVVCLIVGTVSGFRAIALGYERALGRDGLVRVGPADRGEPVATIPMSRGVTVAQRFRVGVGVDHWVGFGIRTVTGGRFPRPGRCRWFLYQREPEQESSADDGSGRTEVRRGSFRASRLRDGTFFPVRFPEIRGAAGHEYELVFEAPDVEPGEAVGLPVVRRNRIGSIRVEDGRPESDRAAQPMALADRSSFDGVGLDLEWIDRPGSVGHDRERNRAR